MEEMENNDYEYLVPVDDYLKVGIHIGTKFKTKAMKNFIFKIRPDGLAILDVQKIDERIRLVAKLLAKYDAKDIVVACRRENGWKAAKLFGKITGVNVFAGRYPPGIMTNTNLENFTEAKAIFVIDPFPDKNAIEDAKKIGIPVISLCDTNNETRNIDLVLPCNNKGKKSLGMLFMLIAREYMKEKGNIKKDADFTYVLEDFSPE